MDLMSHVQMHLGRLDVLFAMMAEDPISPLDQASIGGDTKGIEGWETAQQTHSARQP